MKAEKYNIFCEVAGETTMKVRYGFGATGEEVKRLLETPGLERIRVRIEGSTREAVFLPARLSRLLDIKQRIKALSLSD